MKNLDNIFANSSGFSKSAISVFRISGDKSLDILKQLTKNFKIESIKPKQVYLRSIYVPGTNYLIDNALIIFFKSPNSFTGEDLLEIHVHGSIAIRKILTNTLSEMSGMRAASPGEFTKRAFLNGKLDLTSVEGLSDLLEAETEIQHQQAIIQNSGALAELYNKWKERLVYIMSLIEANIDFSEDIPNDLIKNIEQEIKKLTEEISQYINDNNRGEIIRNGIQLTIFGPPNVGKSSFTNYLIQREISIISNIPGTTRDLIEGHLNIGGFPIIIQDTAGINLNSTDIIEQKGIEITNNAVHKAKIKILILDINDKTYDYLTLKPLVDKNTILLLNKSDINNYNQDNAKFITNIIPLNPIIISLKNNTSTENILSKIIETAKHITESHDTLPPITRERHRNHIQNTLKYLSNFSAEDELVLIAENVRLAINHFSKLTGQITVDDVLEKIFSNFCIGK
ncbi:tRNA uridine-5-carboxymethylaminomethyl(34) synthesis GTPase MnmE [Rickettsia endosymbiont of Cardiosporidium cionae]|uniref:tRNA uridine-5-carboxymethylaminomethyl(34) synthesis GTPase MnmE n=1 Tax=Rickettsia endosymbiont of Cardiosporidium cionae TaxID=2777155 RepID=UPI0018952487|nr:tRNA uridine-5-carboxymethylaminomethyl(34) synthesis GTPase MnmE [Rickettsia endosymbiont of Cardiosporidium cionae]KAF8818983.1 tRNA uridine-5-carboxymethylaminomethyl(34) synthesis GTPase MnmE [Rickettsia endosymbiont of Cardiosporidium cionae]